MGFYCKPEVAEARIGFGSSARTQVPTAETETSQGSIVLADFGAVKDG